MAARGAKACQRLHVDALRPVRLQQVEAAAALDLDALVVRHVDGDVRPVRLRNVDVAGRPEDLGRVEVDEQRAAAALAGSVEADHAVDVLRRSGDQSQAGGVAEEVDEAALDVGLSWEGLVGVEPPQRRALHEHDVDVSWRMRQEPFEERGLAPVPTDVAGVEKPCAAGLDLQRVGVVGGVVDEMRRDPEGTEGERLPADELDRRGRDVGVRDEGRGGLQDAVRGGAERDRQRGAGKVREAPVVDVAVGEHQGEEIAATVELRDRGMTRSVVGIAVER